MFRFLISVSTVAIAISVAAVSCWAADLEEVVAALQTPFQAETAHNRRIRDYSADFFQQSQIASLNRVQQAHGKVTVQFDEQLQGEVPKIRFRWEYVQPSAQEIVSNGEQIWVYLPENNQVIVTKTDSAAEAGENNPMAFLTGLGNLARDFQIVWAEPDRDPDGHYILDLQPRRASALLARLVIVVDRTAVETHLAGSAAAGKQVTFPILSTTIYDANGNSSIIAFRNLQINRGPSVSQFNFVVPAGVDVVRPEEGGLGF